MKTFFTEVDSQQNIGQQDINQLFYRLNFESPRTQLAMKKLGINRSQCILHNQFDYPYEHLKTKNGYKKHLDELRDILTKIVEERKLLIGPGVKIENKQKQVNFVQKIFNVTFNVQLQHDLVQLYESELQMKKLQQRNYDKLHKSIESRLESISNKCKKHNESVYYRLNKFKARQYEDLDDRLTKSMDFGSQFIQIEEKLNTTKQQFISSIHSKTQQSLDYHKKKKQEILEQEEFNRQKLQNTIENSEDMQFIQYFQKNIGINQSGPLNKLQKSYRIQQNNQLKVIQKIGSQTEKNLMNVVNTQKQQEKIILKLKQQEQYRQNRVNQLKQSKSEKQSIREANIFEQLQEKLTTTENKSKQRLNDLQQKMKSLSINRQQKQQDLLNKLVIKLERKKDNIMEKHIQLRYNLKHKNESCQSILGQQLIIEKDDQNQNIEKQQRLIVSKSTKNIQELLNNLKFSKIE